MVVAKNFVSYGVWGVTKYGFTSSTSSILWPGLIAALFKIFGINELIPFFLNIIFATSTLILTNYILKQYVKDIKYCNLFIFISLMVITFLTPIIPLIFTGMEHVLQIFLTIAFVYMSAKILNQEKSQNYEVILLLILASLLTLNRYENLFTVLAVVLLFVIYKKRLKAIYILLSGTIPLIIYGLYSKIQGWYFLPNSLILKSAYLKNLTSLNYILLTLKKLIYTILEPHLLILFITAVFLLYIILKDNFTKKINDFYIIILIIFIFNLIFHISFVQTGYFYRYEAYLIALGLLGTSLGISLCLKDLETLIYQNNIRKYKWNILRYSFLFLLICLFMIPAATNGYGSITSVPQASKNIYEQQYQMALFIEEYYQGKSVGLNDIGIINYMSDIKCLDLWGLGNLEVAQKKNEGNYTTNEISNLTTNNNVSLIIIYDSAFQNKIPPDWIKVGEWEIKGNIVCGDSLVSFYAPNQQYEAYLNEKLRLFSFRLPKDVEQRGKYLTN
ncbi:hypothetical protein [Methanobacterium formicicum]|uniref:Glycosyltransferase RgtA/B/C/D-like domain-containing protein n=1 Tax=Methanobacterium formicicum (strain DSM 3637 / PP1) TaxID=1204725 RepID=K2QDE2_METFP|nr:hypothetical protein [Methanobacterium formicicum]EKF86046.1 hypothetical protein A994_06151 [Methanobacterium formicicum DSM 3637]